MAKTVEMTGERVLANAPMSEAERKVRMELAACYRLAQKNGWDELIYNHISARVPGPEHHFLINPFGLAFEEVTASNLVKVDVEGRVIGETNYPINAAGFTIHSAVHAARPEVGCVIHLHTEAGMALSMLDGGLLPLTQTAMLFQRQLAFHDYEGIAFNLAERERLVRDLGDKSVMILRNHGTLVACPTVGQAFVTMFLLEKAARAQLRAMACNNKLVQASPQAIDMTAQYGKSGAGGLEQAWQAMVRRLDREDTSYQS
ncbi:MAG TPA: class II aldolase/adducin family protein [Stellaceae bacterium]|nr:class II aldolase/adducin family protein [Stellaceae bacterium]